MGALALASLVACGTPPADSSPTPTQAGSATGEDRTGPAINATLLDDNQPRGQEVVVEATITDPSGVAFAALYFRAAGTDFWASESFRNVGGDSYEATIPGSWVGEGGVDWYIEARDASFNRNVSYFPVTGPIGPLYFSTLGEALPFPFEEDFEPEDPDTTRLLLAQTGWTGYVQGFFDGENWQMSSRFSRSGGWSASHLHGSPYQVEGFEDWLVSPPIDLSDAETVELYWHEFIDHPEYATHRLMVSTTSPDPDLLGFVTVFDPLPASEGSGWQESVHVDLSEFAGYPQVFIAFVYEGLWADDWYIDDVVVDTHKPQLVLAEPGFEPDGVRPGDGALLSFGVDNIGLADSGALVAEVMLSFGLKGMRHPMLVLMMLVNSLAVTFGVATLAVGHLNILSICFAAIMIGLGVDFGIHFVTRYLFLRQELYEMDESLVLTGQSVGTGILTSALTTAIAFASAALTGYPGLAELGIIAAGGILVCALMTFTFLPALIALSDEHVEIDELPVPLSGDFWRSAVSGFPITAIAIAIIGIGAVAYNAVNYEDGSVSFNVAYDSNLLKLQDHTLDSVQAERTLAAADESLLYAVAITESQAATDELRSRLLELPTVGRVTELSSRIPQQPGEGQKQLIGQLKSKLQNMPTRTPTFAASNPEVVGVSLDRLFKTLNSSSDLKAHKAAERLDGFLNKFASLPTNKQAQVIDAYQDMMVGSLLKEFGQVASATSLEPVGLEDLPETWRNRYLRVDGERQLWLTKIYPKEEVWNEAALASFVRDVRTVAHDVTGVPVQNFDSAEKMKACYKTIAVYSLAAIALFLLFDFLRPGQKLLTVIPPLLVVGFIGYTSIQRHGNLNPNMLVAIYLGMVAFVATVFDFRNLRDTFIALVPPVGGGLMLLGIMAILNVDFNPINLIVLPLVLGIGVDDGVHMVHDYRRQLMAGSREYTPSGDTMNGVFLTSLTSIVGFGSLMISAHQGLKSVGIVLAIGVACCMAVALILVPPMLVLVAKYQPASFEPVVVRMPKKKKVKAGSDSSDEGSDNGEPEGRRLSRKERRRLQQQQNAA